MTQLLNDIRYWANIEPTRAALALEDGFFSYQQFNDLIQRARSLLAARLGDRKSGIISIHMEHLARSWVWTIAARSLGFDTLNADARTSDHQPVAFLTDIEGLDVGGTPISCVHIGPSVSVEGLQSSDFLADPELVAAGSHLLLSSGTTGIPKIVPFDENQHLVAAIEQTTTLEYHRESVVFGWVFPLHTAVGYRSPVATWGVGGCVVLHRSPKTAFNTFAVTSAILTPGLIEDLVNDFVGMRRRDEMRLIATGGPIGWSLAEKTKRLVTDDLWGMYGSTEVGAACMTPIGSEEDTFLYRPVENCEIRILDEDRIDQPLSEQGNIWVRKQNGADRYLGDQFSTDAFFCDGWFKTGDLGRLREDGRLEILGRANDVLIIRGDKQPSGPTERKVAEALGRSVCIFSDYRAGDLGNLVVVIEGDTALDKSELSQIEEIVATLGVPHRVTSQDVFPRNGMGKVMRSMLISEAHLF